MFSNSIQKLIDIFSKFPTVGPRTAARFVFYLIKLPKEKTDELIASIQSLKDKIKYCSFCFNPFEAAENKTLCPICDNKARQRTVLCVVEKENDLTSIEDTKNYKGLYFILGGTLKMLKKEDVEKIRAQDLTERVLNPEKYGISVPNFEEIIIATNPTPEGEATALYVERKLKSLETAGKKIPKITRLAIGLPRGGELEYADEETLKNAFSGRK